LIASTRPINPEVIGLQNQKFRLARPLALLLALLLLFQVSAAARGPVSQTSCRYTYQLIPEQASGNNRTRFALYVERSDPNSPPLHSGTIALALDNTTIQNIENLVHFTEEEGWQLMSAPAAGTTQQNLTADKTASGLYYVSFGWYWGTGVGTTPVLPDNSDGMLGRQRLGTLEFDFNVTVDDILLLPWTQTKTGEADWRRYQTAVSSGGDAAAYLEVVENTWRMDNLSRPLEGYYQGYYAGELESGQDAQLSVDITPGWYGFRVGAYAPERDATLSIYAFDEASGQYESTPVSVVSASFGTGTGYFKKSISFSGDSEAGATLSHVSGKELGALEKGTYRMVLEKQSHVTATFDGLTVSDEGVFRELLGVTVILPCGDVDGDDKIRQSDRAQLTAQARYGKLATNTVYDLDGDGKVNQVDMAILTSSMNYGKNSLHFKYVIGVA